MLQDYRRAIRSLLQRRGLALSVVATLALSIGATSAVFSAIYAVVLAPLPYPDAERLVSVLETTRQQSTGLVALVRFDEWSRLTRSFEGLAGSYSENLTDTTGSVPERVTAMRTSPRFFGVLGTSAALGRTFNSDEEQFGGPAAIVLSDAVWRSRYGADPAIVGRALRIGDASRTVVGNLRRGGPAMNPRQSPIPLKNRQKRSAHCEGRSQCVRKSDGLRIVYAADVANVADLQLDVGICRV